MSKVTTYKLSTRHGARLSTGFKSRVYRRNWCCIIVQAHLDSLLWSTLPVIAMPCFSIDFKPWSKLKTRVWIYTKSSTSKFYSVILGLGHGPLLMWRNSAFHDYLHDRCPEEQYLSVCRIATEGFQEVSSEVQTIEQALGEEGHNDIAQTVRRLQDKEKTKLQLVSSWCFVYRVM